MSVDYNTSRSMKAAAIGTIMPWTGELSQIPKGWKLCNGDSIRCDEYPLLARVIKDKYGGLNVNFSDPNFIFPYNGYSQAVISLPNLNQRGVADVDYNYFSNDPANRPGPQDTLEARAAVQNYIGTSSSVNANLAIIDNFPAVTDVNFTLQTTALTGVVEGQDYIDGIGSRTVYTMPRKLGRQHMKSHIHSTEIDTVIVTDQATPGVGPGVYEATQVTITAFLVEWDEFYTDLLRNTDTNWEAPANPFSTGPGRFVLGSMNGGKLMNNYRPFNSQSSWHGIKTWFTDYVKQKFRAADGTTTFPARAFQGFINTGDKIPFGDTGDGVETPNFDPGTGTVGGISVAGSDNASIGAGGDGHEVFFDHSGRSFTSNDPNSFPNNHIFSHQHEDFEVKFVQSSLRINETLNVNVTTGGIDPVTPNNLPSAFVIDFQVQTASVSTLYLIRAY